MAKAATDTSETAKSNMGRLKSFGIKEPWQVALLLPNSFDDFRTVRDQFNVEIPEGNCAVLGCLAGTPETRFTNGAPLLIGSLMDTAGAKINFSVFGDSKEFKKELLEQPAKILLLGKIEYFNNQPWLRSPEIISEKWIGRLRPRYPGKPKTIKPETVRTRVLTNLKEAVPLAAEFIAQELAEFGSRKKLAEIAGLRNWDIEAIIYNAHVPKTPEVGELAQKAMEYLAALGIVKDAKKSQGTAHCKPLQVGDWRQFAAMVPWELTEEQNKAISDIIKDVTTPGPPMRRLLNGDVGTGKSSILGVVAATLVDANYSVAILLPNSTLAAQMAEEFQSWMPDLPLQLVTGEQHDDICAPLVIGTTALLFRDLGNPTLIICDEQQKFAHNQREQLAGPNTHILESTATCIPRSAALVRYGMVKVSKITRDHTPKDIVSKIWQKKEWPELYSSLQETIKSGAQAMLVYPLRESGDETDKSGQEQDSKKKFDLRSATEIFEKWEKILPGRVRLIHGQMTDGEKQKAITDMREEKATVLVSTSICEIGLTIPNLRHVIVAHPDRFGVSSLHQIRGRLCRRHGGKGKFDMFLPYPVKEDTMKRLRVLEQTRDGFKIAEEDLKLRGCGDLGNGSKQSGTDETFLFGRPIRLDILDKVMATIEV